MRTAVTLAPPPEGRQEWPTVQCRKCGALWQQEWWEAPNRACAACTRRLVEELTAVQRVGGDRAVCERLGV